MSKTFTYVLIVIMVYLLIIFPKMVSKSGTVEEREENENGVVNRSTTIRAGYTT